MPYTNVIAETLLADPTPMIIWVILIALTVPAMLLLTNQDRLHDPRAAFRDVVAALRTRGGLAALRREQAEAVEAARFADEVRACAERADAATAQWQRHLEQAEQEQLAAWQAWLDADSRLRRSLTATAFGTPWSVRTCEEYAARERFLHHAVTTAAKAGDLPTAAVADALAARNGWDPRLHPLEQELVVHRAAARHRWHRYQLAATAQQATQHHTDLARRAAASLHQTATAAPEQSRPLIPASASSPATGNRRPADVRPA
jgi:hypothetical protein